MNKKYAIVRVDKDWCPYYADKEFIIPCSNFCENRFECKDCRYGDTKEQLIRKVAQGIIIASRKRQIYIANPKAFSKAVSKIIVEFLGVE